MRRPLDLPIDLRTALLQAVLIRARKDPLSLPRGIRALAVAVLEADEEEE